MMQGSVRCPRCGTALAAGKVVCPHCELPIARRGDVRRNATGLALPSPIQGHATVMIAVLLTVAVLGMLAFRSLQGIGPFTAQVVQVQPTRAGVDVQLEVTNDGTRAGKAKCRVTATDADGEIHHSPVLLTGSIQPHSSGRLTLPLEGVGAARPVGATCS
jgi:hypothetical protein